MHEQIINENVLERLGIAYCELDLAGKITQANQPFRNSLQRSVTELQGRMLKDLLQPEDAPRLQRVKNAFAQGTSLIKGVHLHFLRPNNRILNTEASFALLPGGLGWGCALRELPSIERESGHLPRSTAERELEIGRQIQAGFLPKKLPNFPNWQIACQLQAAHEVAGDFYDAFLFPGGKRIGLLVGDVTDKGVGAALFMALFRSLIRAFADQHYALGWMDILADIKSKPQENRSIGQRREVLSPGVIALKSAIDYTNRYIAIHHDDASMFATIFFAVLNPYTGTLNYINGGHLPPVLFGPSHPLERLNPTGPAVGLFPDVEYSIGQARLAPEDTLLVYTDGVTDALSPENTRFEEGRLLAFLEQPVSSAQALLDQIWNRIEAHIAGASQFDDITLLALRHSPSK